MEIKNKFFIFILLIFSSLFIFPNSNLIINKITFEGIKVTHTDYLRSQISIKEGSIWNESIKQQLVNELLKLTKIIEEVEIKEDILNENKVNIIVKIVEKSPFILVPFFTYSNSRGFIPKAIFRFFNVAGYNKYLKSKVEFVPTESFNFNIRYEDPSVLNKSNMSYYIDCWFNTSIINYFANVEIINNNLSNTKIKGIPPIGAFGNDGSQRWNRELFYEFNTTFQYQYTLPYYNYTFIPNFSFYFKRIQEAVDGNNDFIENEKIRQTIISPYFSFFTSFPVQGKNIYFQPVFWISYYHHWGKDTFSDAFKESKKYKNYSELYSEGQFRIGQKFSIPIFLNLVNIWLVPSVEISYFKFNAYAHYDFINFVILDYYDQNLNIYTYIRDNVNLSLTLTFDKNLNYKDGNHRFNILLAYYQRLYGDWGVTRLVRDGYVDGTKDGKLDSLTEYYPNYTRFFFQFSYWFNLRFLNNHIFKLRTRLFAYFNDYLEYSTYSPTESADDLAPGKIRGWAGLFMLLKYELPLFFVSTPAFLSKKVSRTLKWEAYWDFLLEPGLAQNNQPEIRWIEENGGYKERNRYTIDRNNIHLFPALTVGTAIRVLPRFVPIQIKLNIAANLWTIIRDKEIHGKTILLEFSIEDAF